MIFSTIKVVATSIHKLEGHDSCYTKTVRRIRIDEHVFQELVLITRSNWAEDQAVREHQRKQDEHHQHSIQPAKNNIGALIRVGRGENKSSMSRSPELYSSDNSSACYTTKPS